MIAFVGKPKRFADIGCDHGFVGASVSALKQVKKVYFNDISQKCLDKAVVSAKEFGNIKKCVFDKGFGLSGFNNLKIDTCLIAGMGGEEIVKILENKPKKLKIKNLCLQPATKMLYLKRWLRDHSYKIVKDEFFCDGEVFYNIFKAKKGRCKLDEVSLAFGKQNLDEPSQVFKNYIFTELSKKQSYVKDVTSLKLTEEINFLNQAKRRIEENERRN